MIDPTAPAPNLTPLRHVWWLLLLVGVLGVVAGIVVLVWPDSA